MQYCLQISGIADYSIEFHGTSAIRAGLNKTKKNFKKKNLIKEQSKISVMKFFQGFWGIPKTTACIGY